MSEGDLYRCIKAVDKRKIRGGDHRSEDFKTKDSSESFVNSAEQTAKKVGTSSTKVRKARAVMDRADAATDTAVEDGMMSINKAYNKTPKRRVSKQTAKAEKESKKIEKENAAAKKDEAASDFLELKKAYETFFDCMKRFQADSEIEEIKKYVPEVRNWIEDLRDMTDTWLAEEPETASAA